MMTKTSTTGAPQIDVAGLSWTNVPLNQANRGKIRSQLTSHLGESTVVCASNTACQDGTGYQPGGNMLTVVGRQTGRMARMGSDTRGWFAWSEMQGKHDEGILVISVYRFSQTIGTMAGPNTAYSQQIN